MSDNTHNMTTRSKLNNNISISPPDDEFDDPFEEDEDENGNLKGFIDYDCDEEINSEELDKVLKGLSNKPKLKKKDN